jgi:glycosyltransferase involved in cell wall biosynthesis
MQPPATKLSITYSLADQSFARTKSLGILNVSVDLLHALARREDCGCLTVLSNRFLKEEISPSDRVTVETHDSAVGGGLGRILWDQFGVYSSAERAGNEWLFLPKGFASFIRRCPVRLATFVHDTMQDHYDRHYPSAVSSIEAAYFRTAFRASILQSEIVFTPSEFTRNEIIRVAREKNWPLPRLVCCGEGFDLPAASSDTERQGIVVLASRFPHKLTRRAVEFLDRWSRENLNGKPIHWIGSFPDKLTVPDRPGWQRHAILPESAFRNLMAQARAVVSFTDYEGFGRSPVEAGLAGACPVFSSIPTSREVMRDCGYSFDNTDYESFASALRQALAASPEQLQAWAGELSARHNWNGVAERVARALASVMPLSQS